MTTASRRALGMQSLEIRSETNGTERVDSCGRGGAEMSYAVSACPPTPSTRWANGAQLANQKPLMFLSLFPGGIMRYVTNSAVWAIVAMLLTANGPPSACAAPIAAASYTAYYRVGFANEHDISGQKNGPGILAYEASRNWGGDPPRIGSCLLYTSPSPRDS